MLVNLMGSLRFYIFVAIGVVAAVYFFRGLVSPNTKGTSVFSFFCVVFIVLLDWFVQASTGRGFEDRAKCTLFSNQEYCKVISSETDTSNSKNIILSNEMKPDEITPIIDEPDLVQGDTQIPEGIDFCSGKTQLSPEYRTEYADVVIQEMGSELVTVPATFETVFELFIVKPSHYEGARFSTRTVDLVVQESSVEYVSVPAVYETYSEEVRFPVSGQIGSYENRSVKTPARVLERVIPGITKSVTEYKLISDGPRSNRLIPATTLTNGRRVVKTPAQTMERTIPRVTQTLSNRYIVKGATTMPIEEVCNLDKETKLKQAVIEELRKLGLITPQTGGATDKNIALALGRYQIRKGIPSSGTVTPETLSAMNIEYQIKVR